jgi:ferrous iron transport protein B
MENKHITIALAGNANVGKSVLFNALTGLHQHIGNWPGKTVERTEGTLHFKDYTVDVIDLPGIYSLSTFSIEELISREYIAKEKPDLVVNVVDASVLERNLYFTLQLLELGPPMIIALNQMDLARDKGISIDHEKLGRLLGVPVVPTIATKGVGIYDLIEKSIEMVEGRVETKRADIEYGREIEEKIRSLVRRLKGVQIGYPSRWIAMKLLEGDEELRKEIGRIDDSIISAAEGYTGEIEDVHREPCTTVVTSERYNVAHRIACEAEEIVEPEKPTTAVRLHALTTNKFLGYPIMAASLLSVFLTVFSFGDLLSSHLNDLFEGLRPMIQVWFGTGPLGEVVWGGLVEGVLAGVTIVLPYVIPFYIILGLLEDSGYLTRIAFLMDNAMHRMGLHGKAFIPMMLGFGCNVPACLGCRIMETQRERLIAAFVSTLVPCAARSIIILGLVGSYVGIDWALTLYAIDLVIIFILGRIAFKVLPGEPIGLIMEMHPYRVPSLSVVAKQTWFRVREFVYIALPFIIASSFFIKLLDVVNMLEPIGEILSPVTVTWLGLPAFVGVILIFGVLRKELTLVMLAALAGTTNFAAILTPIQMIVLALVTMLYIPCIATIAVLLKEFGWRRALYITVFEIAFAVLLGGFAYRLLAFIW